MSQAIATRRSAIGETIPAIFAREYSRRRGGEEEEEEETRRKRKIEDGRKNDR
jgi:hypothetical protein